MCIMMVCHERTSFTMHRQSQALTQPISGVDADVDQHHIMILFSTTEWLAVSNRVGAHTHTPGAGSTVTQLSAPPPWAPPSLPNLPLGVVVGLRFWGANFIEGPAPTTTYRVHEFAADMAAAFSGLCHVDPIEVLVHTVTSGGHHRYDGGFKAPPLPSPHDSYPTVDVTLTSMCAHKLVLNIQGQITALNMLVWSCRGNLGQLAGNNWFFK